MKALRYVLKVLEIYKQKCFETGKLLAIETQKWPGWGRKIQFLQTLRQTYCSEYKKNIIQKYFLNLNLFDDQIHRVRQPILFLSRELCHPRGTKQGLLWGTEKTGPVLSSATFIFYLPFHLLRMQRSSFCPTRRMETAPTCSESEEMTNSFCPWSFSVKTGIGMWNIIELNEPTKKTIRK